MDRRDFVAGSMAAAAVSLQWLRATRAFAATYNASAGAIVFGAIVRAILPFEDPRFAIAPGIVQRRAEGLFKVELDPAIQSGFAQFDDLRLFQSPPQELLTAEAAYFPIDEPERGLASPFAARQARDVKAFAAFYQKLQPKAALFHDLHLSDARNYCALWAHSALGVRRRLYQSVKSLVMAAAYSTDEVWAIVSYAGPLLHFRSP